MIKLRNLTEEDLDRLLAKKVQERISLERHLCEINGQQYDEDWGELPKELDDRVFDFCQEENVYYIDALKILTSYSPNDELDYIKRNREIHEEILNKLSRDDLKTYSEKYADFDFDDCDLFTEE